MNDIESNTGGPVVTSAGRQPSAVSRNVLSAITEGRAGQLSTGREAPSATVQQPQPNNPYLDRVRNIPSPMVKTYLVVWNAIIVGTALCGIFGTARPVA